MERIGKILEELKQQVGIQINQTKQLGANLNILLNDIDDNAPIKKSERKAHDKLSLEATRMSTELDSSLSSWLTLHQRADQVQHDLAVLFKDRNSHSHLQQELTTRFESIQLQFATLSSSAPAPAPAVKEPAVKKPKKTTKSTSLTISATVLDTYTLPFNPTLTSKAPHSTTYAQSSNLLGVMNSLSETKSGALDKWHDEHAESFKVEAVHLWEKKEDTSEKKVIGEGRKRVRRGTVEDAVEEPRAGPSKLPSQPQPTTIKKLSQPPKLSQPKRSRPPSQSTNQPLTTTKPTSTKHSLLPPPSAPHSPPPRPSQRRSATITKPPLPRSPPRPARPSQLKNDPFHIPSSDDMDWIFDVDEPIISLPPPIPPPPIIPQSSVKQRSIPQSPGIIIPESDFENNLPLPPPLPKASTSKLSHPTTSNKEEEEEEEEEDSLIIFKRPFDPEKPSKSKKRKALIIESTSEGGEETSSPPVVGFWRVGAVKNVGNGFRDVESSVEIVRTQKVGEGKGKGKGRLRRGGERRLVMEEGDLEEEREEVVGRMKEKGKGKAKATTTSSKSKSKSTTTKKSLPTKSKSKSKKPRLSPSAFKTIFDLEAINSSASGSESSSEGYSSENSIDRNFVAREEEDEDEDEGESMMRFRAESLMTQVEGRGLFKNGVVKPGAFRMDHNGNRGVGSPMTPNSQDQWSFDSFCVDDDAEVEFESDSSSDEDL